MIPALEKVKHIIAVASGKGGVGKSTVATNLALALAKKEFKVGLMDADIYGPSIPMMLGLDERPDVENEKVIPVEKFGMKVLSMGILTTEDTPIIWRGPMVDGVLKQFLGHVEWGELDYLVIDLPPGTGDAQLTLSQQAGLSGALIVSTPQAVALIDARRAVRMFEQVHVPVLGLVENMSYFSPEGLGEKYYLFGKGKLEKVAEELKIPILASLPIDPKVAQGGDAGQPTVVASENSEVAQSYLNLAEVIVDKVKSLPNKNQSLPGQLPAFK